MLPVEQPFKTYTGVDGEPLDNGYVYFGEPDQDPITHPVTVYWDADGTLPAAQPLRTVNGYIVNAGTPANVYFDGAYSELVRDAKDRQVFYARTSAEFSIGTLMNSLIAKIDSLASATGAALVGFAQLGIGTLTRTVLDKLRERRSIDDYPDLQNALDNISGSEQTGFGAKPVILDLLGKEITITGTVYWPINVRFVNGSLTSAGGRLVLRNPFLANTALRGNTEYWKDMNASAADVKFKCLVVINCYIGAHFDNCEFTGGVVHVNSNDLWTEYTTYRRCLIAGNTALGAGALFDGNTAGTSTYSTGAGAGRADGSFGYTRFIGCKTDSTAPTVGIKCTSGATLYNSIMQFDGYARGADGGFLYVKDAKVAQCNFDVRLESFGDAANIISLDTGSQFWFNGGSIRSASPTMQFAQVGTADIRNNTILVTGAVLQDKTGAVVASGDTVQSTIRNHLLQRLDYFSGSEYVIDTVSGSTVSAKVALESRVPGSGLFISRANDTRSSTSRNWGWAANRIAFGDYVLMESTTRLDDPSVARLQVLSGSGSIVPTTDNVAALGQPPARYTTLYASSATINTSDERQKEQIVDVPEAVLRAWARVKFCQFKFKDAVDLKGPDARLHIGLLAQQVKASFEAEGLDAFAYGLLCYDEWEARPAILDEAGNELAPARPAGSIYGVRYEEALALECAYLRSRLAA